MTAEITFANFNTDQLRLEQFVQCDQYPDGVLRGMAAVYGAHIGVAFTEDNLQELVNATGKSAELQKNIAVVEAALGGPADALSTARHFVEVSGIHAPVERALWTTAQRAPQAGDPCFDGPHTTVVMSGVAGWQEQTTNFLQPADNEPVTPGQRGELVYASGNRIASSDTEIGNPGKNLYPHPDVVDFLRQKLRVPTEGELAAAYAVPQLKNAGYVVHHYQLPEGDKADQALMYLFAERPALGYGRLTAVRVANAGLQCARQVRDAARAVNPSFDLDPGRPDMFLRTTALPLAGSLDETKRPREFQNPVAPQRQIPLTAKMLLQRYF